MIKKLFFILILAILSNPLKGAVAIPLWTQTLYTPQSAQKMFTYVDDPQPADYDSLYFQFSQSSSFTGYGTFISAVKFIKGNQLYYVPTPPNEYNTSYYVRLAGKIGSDISNWTTSKSYNTNIKLTTTIYGLQTTNTKYNGLVLQSHGANEFTYEMQTDTNQYFATPALTSYIKNISDPYGSYFAYPILLKPGEKRYFRVRPYKKNSQGNWSNTEVRINNDSRTFQFNTQPLNYEFNASVTWSQMLDDQAVNDTSFHYVIYSDTTPNFNSPLLFRTRLSGKTLNATVNISPYVKNYIAGFLTNNITNIPLKDTLKIAGPGKSIKPVFKLTDERFVFNNCSTISRIYLQFDTTLAFNSGARLLDSIKNPYKQSILQYGVIDFTKYARMYVRTRSGNNSTLFDWELYDTIRFDRPGILMPTKLDTTILVPSFKSIPLKLVTEYESEFDIKPDFSSPHRVRVSHTNTSLFNFGKTTYNKVYYVRSRAKSGGIYSDWSAPVKYQPTTRYQYGSPLYLSVPYKAGIAAFGFKTGSLYAHFQVAKDSFFINPYEFTECLTSGEPDIFLKLMAEHNQKWIRIRQWHEWDTSQWSQPFKLILSNTSGTPPFAPYVFPANCQTINGGSTTFRWRKNPAVDFYKLQINLTLTAMEDYIWTADTFVQVQLKANRSYKYSVIAAKSGNPNLSISPVYYFNTVNGTADVNDVSNENILIFPNPAKDEIVIASAYTNSLNNGFAEIINTAGKCVKRIALDSGQTKVDISALADGIYFVQINTMGKLLTQKISVQH